jgi:hypothetical protein
MQSPSYVAHWRAARRRWYLFIAVWLGFIPFGCTVDWLFSGHSGWTILWMIPFWWSGYQAAAFKCPRCKGWFTVSTGGWGNALATKCLRCGLPRGSPTDPDWPKPPQLIRSKYGFTV